MNWHTRLRALIDELLALALEVSRLGRYGIIEPQPRAPIRPHVLQAYEQRCGIPMPPSYRALLELSNGYDGLLFGGDLLAVEDVTPGGSAWERISEWKLETAKYGGGRVLDGIMVAYMAQPNNWAFLDPNTAQPSGEMALVSWDPEFEVEHRGVEEFLRSIADRYQMALADGDS